MAVSKIIENSNIDRYQICLTGVKNLVFNLINLELQILCFILISVCYFVYSFVTFFISYLPYVHLYIYLFLHLQSIIYVFTIPFLPLSESHLFAEALSVIAGIQPSLSNIIAHTFQVNIIPNIVRNIIHLNILLYFIIIIYMIIIFYFVLFSKTIQGKHRTESVLFYLGSKFIRL